jgi:MFS family permease
VITFPIILEFDLTFTQVSLLTGYQLCVIGSLAIFVSAICVKYGKRGPFLVSLVFLLAGGIVCACAKSYEGLLGGRLLQGVGSTAFESVTFALVGDMYFVHERGSRMAFFIVSQSGLLLLPSLIAGQVAQAMGWRWVFWLLVIATAVGSVGIILFGWETSYNRNAVYNIDTSSHDVSWPCYSVEGETRLTDR